MNKKSGVSYKEIEMKKKKKKDFYIPFLYLLIAGKRNGREKRKRD